MPALDDLDTASRRRIDVLNLCLLHFTRFPPVTLLGSASIAFPKVDSLTYIRR
jgi:hypothetical protein